MSINVTRSSMPPFEEYCDEIRGLWDSRWLTNMGCKHRQLEEDLQRYLQCGQITLFTNGHLALENILQASSRRPSPLPRRRMPSCAAAVSRYSVTSTR